MKRTERTGLGLLLLAIAFMIIHDSPNEAVFHIVMHSLFVIIALVGYLYLVYGEK